MKEGLGQALAELGQYQKAESLLKRSLEIFRSRNRNTQVQEVRERLAELYAEWGKPGKAAQYQSTGRSGNQASYQMQDFAVHFCFSRGCRDDLRVVLTWA